MIIKAKGIRWIDDIVKPQIVLISTIFLQIKIITFMFHSPLNVSFSAPSFQIMSHIQIDFIIEWILSNKIFKFFGDYLGWIAMASSEIFGC